MRSVAIEEFGGAEVLRAAEAVKPVPADGQVLVRVRAAGVNPIDFKTRMGQGVTRSWPEPLFPVILGWDVSGVVEESRAPDLQVGDEVYGMVGFPDRASAYAEYVVSPVAHLAAKPRSISHIAAAAVPLAALTAWQALFVTAGLQAGQTVLVHAAAGGVGHFAVQFAKWKEARVIATASARNLDFVKGLGADQVIDYTREDFAAAARNVDVVFHTIAPAERARSFRTLRKDGFLVSITGVVPPEEAAAASARAERAPQRGAIARDRTPDRRRHGEAGHRQDISPGGRRARAPSC
jgi:NADPH:quinone reductase-like Zn-dependent oxidoreductase